MITVEAIIKRWDGIGAFAAAVGCAPATANHWRLRDNIPAEWFSAVSRAAFAKGFIDITPEFLANRAEMRRLMHKAKAMARAESAAA